MQLFHASSRRKYDLNNMTSLLDIFPKILNILFSNVHGTLSKTDHKLSHKTSPNIFLKIVMTQNIVNRTKFTNKKRKLN